MSVGKPGSRRSLAPLMRKRIRKLLRRKNLSVRDEIDILKVAATIEKVGRADADEGWGSDLPSPHD